MSLFLTLLPYLWQLFTAVVGIITKRSQDAADAQKKYMIDQAEFHSAVQEAIQKLTTDAKKESDQARKIDDQVDRDMKKGGP